MHSVGVLLVAAFPWIGYAAYLLPLRRESAELSWLLAHRLSYRLDGTSFDEFLADKPRPIQRVGRWLLPGLSAAASGSAPIPAPEIEVRESPIGGRGVFTLVRQRGGRAISEFRVEREVTPDAPLRPEHDERPEHCPVIDGRTLLVASPERDVNHSCDPNSYLRYGSTGVDIVARRDIDRDGELTFDYLINNAGGNRWSCGCGVSRCRGETGKSFFTLPEEIQREYLPLLAPWFAERHAAQLEHLVDAAAGDVCPLG